jgi:hypothetical protein
MMIKARELRVGNVAERHNRIAPLSEGSIANALTKGYAFFRVPITEKMLLDSGFKEVQARAGVWKAFVKNGVRVHLSNSGNFYFKSRSIGVDQLQNIYLALTGDELEISL